MSRPLVRMAAAAALSALLGGCGTVDAIREFKTTAKPDVFGPVVTITDENTGQSIEIGRGQELVVKLATDPSRGSRWVRDTVVVGLLVPAGDSTFERQTLDKNAFEVGGFDVFRFKPAGPGQQTLRFEYRRKWLVETTPAQVVSFNVTVR